MSKDENIDFLKYEGKKVGELKIPGCCSFETNKVIGSRKYDALEDYLVYIVEDLQKSVPGVIKNISPKNGYLSVEVSDAVKEYFSKNMDSIVDSYFDKDSNFEKLKANGSFLYFSDIVSDGLDLIEEPDFDFDKSNGGFKNNGSYNLVKPIKRQDPSLLYQNAFSSAPFDVSSDCICVRVRDVQIKGKMNYE